MTMSRNITSIVNQLVKKHHTRNPFAIAEALDVIVMHYPLEMRGMYFYASRCHMIYINDTLSNHEKRLVCAHELGHMIMHKGTNSIFLSRSTHLNTSKYEIEANRFAINLLISDEDIWEHVWTYNDLTLQQLSDLFGYDEKLIELRIKDFN